MIAQNYRNNGGFWIAGSVCKRCGPNPENHVEIELNVKNYGPQRERVSCICHQCRYTGTGISAIAHFVGHMAENIPFEAASRRSIEWDD